MQSRTYPNACVPSCPCLCKKALYGCRCSRIVSAAHLGVMLLEDRVSHRGEGSDLSFFSGHSPWREVLDILDDLSFAFIASRLSGWYQA